MTTTNAVNYPRAHALRLLPAGANPHAALNDLACGMSLVNREEAIVVRDVFSGGKVVESKPYFRGERIPYESNPYTTIDMQPPPVPWHLLPVGLGGLADLTSKEATRYGSALSAVNLRVTEEGYRAEVTDGCTLVRVTGPSGPAQDYPALPALESAPNGETSALIPAKDWKEAFKSIPKRTQPILCNVAVVIGKDQTTLATTNLEGASVRSPRNVEGRWPQTDRGIPKADAAVASVKLDARRLMDLLKVSLAFTPDGSANEVILTVNKNGAPFTLTTARGEQVFLGLLMPLK